MLESARNTAELSISRYKQGLVSFLEVVDAERSRLDAELESIQILKEIRYFHNYVPMLMEKGFIKKDCSCQYE